MKRPILNIAERQLIIQGTLSGDILKCRLAFTILCRELTRPLFKLFDKIFNKGKH